MMGLWSWDVQKNIFRGDAAYAKLFGFTKIKAAAGVPIDEIIPALHPDDRRVLERAITTARNGRSSPLLEYRVRGRDRRWRSVIASGRCLCDSEGRPNQYLGIVVEIDQVVKHVRASLDKLADSTLEARNYAVADKREFITHLLDIVLMEVGFALAKREMDRREQH
jgi:hypothetical protein